MLTLPVQYLEILEVGCMAHARRYFKEALPTAAVPCAQALAIFGQLYAIERAASDKHLDAARATSSSAGAGSADPA